LKVLIREKPEARCSFSDRESRHGKYKSLCRKKYKNRKRKAVSGKKSVLEWRGPVYALIQAGRYERTAARENEKKKGGGEPKKFVRNTSSVRASSS